jgi:tungstate transport system permease protein
MAPVGAAMEIGIEPTARHAADLGIVPVVVEDACGSGHAEAAQRSRAAQIRWGRCFHRRGGVLPGAQDGGINDFARSVGAALALIGEANPELLGIVALSLRVSLTASIVALLIGAPIGAWLAISRFPGRQLIIVLTNALLGLPPVVVGLALYLLFSRSGPLGPAGILFTPMAMVIAQTLLATPIVVALVHRPSTLLWAEYGDLARTDGLSLVRSIALLFALGRASLLTAFLAAFGRAIAEVGAIIIVGGNIRGF